MKTFTCLGISLVSISSGRERVQEELRMKSSPSGCHSPLETVRAEPDGEDIVEPEVEMEEVIVQPAGGDLEDANVKIEEVIVQTKPAGGDD